MVVQFGKCRLEIVQGDITQQKVDAIVNAANSALAGGGGVDGALHRAAGPTLMNETRALYPEGCPTGSAVATTAGRLNAKYVFHTVGPVWKGGTSGEPDQLASCYQTCLELAREHSCQSVAFPAVSTGVYGYPIDLAASSSLKIVRRFLIDHQTPELVRFVLFGEGAYGAFARVLESMTE
ncbi:MAG: O-acetyl-ADP-ribose deacetylase [Planctomycetota bacterium]|nr:O-acetyl-ADP-ribose deacetylase [Planctomycetota bacterium]MDA1252599.1 O-acetyl-ADP-ribose deacetylase [Planctomycetota bacterium]